MDALIRSILGTFDTGIRGLLGFLLKIYQRFISPLLGNRCRFYPTCSDYAAQLFSSKAQSLPLSMLYVVWRLLRCNPCFRGGIDLPPSEPKRNVRN
jgi:putative membrane protein insertion efficiency factor